MSDTFNHYADAIDNYMEEEWDGIDPNPFMPYIGRTPEEVSIGIANIVRGRSPYTSRQEYWFGADYADDVVQAITFSDYRGDYESKKQKKIKKTITCKNCKQDGLHWQQNDGKWRLYSNNGELHSCYAKPETKETNFDNNITKGNYKFIFKSDHVEDWYVVLHKGMEIGRVLHKDKWTWFGHKHVDIPENVCQSMQRFADILNETQT